MVDQSKLVLPLNSSGAMVTGSHEAIDGKVYNFASSGSEFNLGGDTSGF